MSRKGGCGRTGGLCMSVCELLTENFLWGPGAHPTAERAAQWLSCPASPSSPTPHLLTTCVPFCTPGRFGANPAQRPISVSECLINMDASGKTTTFLCLKTSSFLMSVHASSLGTLPVVRRFCSCRVTSREMLASLWPVSAS